MTTLFQLWLNDQPISSTANSVAEFLQQQQIGGAFVLALNGQFLPQALYASTGLQPEDRLELLRPIAGG